jgi:uncharacterized protein YjbI with pentapeptide repeats
MIEIKHKVSHAVILRSAVDTLNGKNLTGFDLTSADLSGTSMCYTCFCRTKLHLADLSGAILCNAVLDAANLELANLSKADLSSASLLGAQLRGANLSGASLRYALFTGADLTGANLEKADLSMADLRANFRDAVLVNADLRGANLAGANLQYANLTGADLTSANLDGAKLVGAKLNGAKLDRGMEASARAVMSAPTMFTRRAETRTTKAPLDIDFGSAGSKSSRRTEKRVAPSVESAPSFGGADAGHPGPLGAAANGNQRFDKWKNFLRVRYLGGLTQNSLPIKEGSEGVVIEFFGPLGNDYWQIQFPAVGTVYVHRQQLEVLDRAFFDDAQGQQESETEKLLKGAKETVLYSTNGGKFKSLVIWYSDSRYLSVEEFKKAESLIRLCKQRHIRVTKDRWFN